MELWDIYDEDRRPTGRYAVRDVTPLQPGEYHLVVHVCVFSRDGKLLIQRRALGRKSAGGLWDITAGGSAVAGETSLQAAQRELKEEVGLSLELPRPFFTINFPVGFDDVYLVQADPDLSELVLQEEEVCDAKWATEEEVLTLLDAGLFVKYRRHFLELLFETNCGYGMILRGVK